MILKKILRLQFLPFVKEEMLRVSGVVEYKFEKYSERFISAIFDFVKELKIDRGIWLNYQIKSGELTLCSGGEVFLVDIKLFIAYNYCNR